MNKVTREDIARVLSGEIPVKHGAGILAAANSIRGNKTVSEGSKKGFSGWGEVSEIIGVVNTKEYILKVFFENGAIREIDLSNYIKCSSEPTVIKYQERTNLTTRSSKDYLSTLNRCGSRDISFGNRSNTL